MSNDRRPPYGYVLERDLGFINRFPLPGTARLEAVEQEHGFDYRAAEAGAGNGEPRPEEGLGYVELAAFPLLEPLQVAVDRATGERVLVCGGEDPLAGLAEPLETLGWIESYPINPRRPPHAELAFDAIGLVRALDRKRRRHVYGAGEIPGGELVAELGCLHRTPGDESVAVWIEPDGTLVTDAYSPPRGRPSLRAAARWTLAPLAWRDLPQRAARAGAAARRAAASIRFLVMGRGGSSKRVASKGPATAAPTGYVHREAAANRRPLYAASHPVTGDQLLTSSLLEAGDLGYVGATLIGYLVPAAPVTGSFDRRAVSIPWASRFGLRART